ncbi:HAD family hydrolase [Nocardia farcinica]|uniref:HAD family hydrolase n=1 Tax=Nocardia farcinica TaxID=37329 RepID=UPI0029351225|nr:HAD family hydrolase [Nocardia farcinica]
MIEAVVFDVGETLVDETREYGTWADWLGVPRHTFVAVLGATIARGLDYRETFQVFRPGFDLTAEREARAAAGRPEWFGEDDLYADVRPALAELEAAGIWVGVVGNQTARAGELLRGLDLPCDFIATSEEWGVSKPDTAFFHRIIEEADRPADVILYVGDRLDNDIAPAKGVGMRTAFIQRGPWGWIHRDSPSVAELADFRIDFLTELPALVATGADMLDSPSHHRRGYPVQLGAAGVLDERLACGEGGVVDAYGLPHLRWSLVPVGACHVDVAALPTQFRRQGPCPGVP